MKKLSLVLRLAAILGAIACVWMWFNVKGQIKQANADMQGVQGDTLLAKSAQVPGILAEKSKLDKDLKATKASLDTQTQKAKSLAGELESERNQNVRLNNEKVKLSNDLRKTKISLEDSQKSVSQKEAFIEQLKKELVAAKNVQVDNTQIDSLKQENTVLKNQLNQVKKDLEVASEKAKILDLAEVVTYEDIDLEAGKKKITKKYIVPYVGEGQTAVVTNVSQSDNILTINKGKKDQLADGQKINLANKGVLIANAKVLKAGEEFAVLEFSPRKGLPETIEAQDVLELVKVVNIEEKKAEEAAPKAEAPKAEPAETEEAEEE